MMNDGVMIAFLPTDTEWAKQLDPHLTLVYCGTISDLRPSAFNELAKDAISVALMTNAFVLEVTGVEVFGDDEKVDVLTLSSTPQLRAARGLVERWNASGKPFSPHVTVGPEGSARGYLPTRLYFDRVIVAWGDEKMIFSLRG